MGQKHIPHRLLSQPQETYAILFASNGRTERLEYCVEMIGQIAKIADEDGFDRFARLLRNILEHEALPRLTELEAEPKTTLYRDPPV